MSTPGLVTDPLVPGGVGGWWRRVVSLTGRCFLRLFSLYLTFAVFWAVQAEAVDRLWRRLNWWLAEGIGETIAVCILSIALLLGAVGVFRVAAGHAVWPRLWARWLPRRWLLITVCLAVFWFGCYWLPVLLELRLINIYSVLITACAIALFGPSLLGVAVLERSGPWRCITLAGKRCLPTAARLLPLAACYAIYIGLFYLSCIWLLPGIAEAKEPFLFRLALGTVNSAFLVLATVASIVSYAELRARETDEPISTETLISGLTMHQ